VVLGEDPAAEKRIKRMVPTLAEFCEDRYLPYIKAEKRSWLTDVSYTVPHTAPVRLMNISEKTDLKFIQEF